MQRLFDYPATVHPNMLERCTNCRKSWGTLPDLDKLTDEPRVILLAHQTDGGRICAKCFTPKLATMYLDIPWHKMAWGYYWDEVA